MSGKIIVNNDVKIIFLVYANVENTAEAQIHHI